MQVEDGDATEQSEDGDTVMENVEAAHSVLTEGARQAGSPEPQGKTLSTRVDDSEREATAIQEPVDCSTGA